MYVATSGTFSIAGYEVCQVSPRRIESTLVCIPTKGKGRIGLNQSRTHRELEQGLVPEWRVKYFDYKLGKKKVKAVVRALKYVNQTPKTPGRQKSANISFPYIPDFASSQSPMLDPDNLLPPSQDPTESASLHNLADTTVAPNEQNERPPNEASPLAIQDRKSREPEDDLYSQWDSGALTNYGSIIPSPPTQPNPVLFHPSSLELPDPILSPEGDSYARHNRAWRRSRLNPNITPVGVNTSGPYKFNIPPTPTRTELSIPTERRSHFWPRRGSSTTGGFSSPARPPPPLIRRIFSTAGLDSPQSVDIPMEAYKEFDARQADFLKFLDKELNKIETFYKMKETEAGERLRILRQQLHEMRDRRLGELLMIQNAKNLAKRDQGHVDSDNGEGSSNENRGNERFSAALKWIQPLESVIGGPHIGKNSKALEAMGGSSSGTPSELRQGGGPSNTDSWRDFTRRPHQQRPPHHDDVPYRSAKRKLRLALQEFYRGLELLKSYALLNRTAFRKINKKYDKAVRARPTGRYMSEKVNKAWFVQSEVLEGQIVAVEDLYARYFERGNHKIAVGKLRTKHTRAEDYTGSIFRNGLLISAGLVFGMQGVIRGALLLSSDNDMERNNASYLLQIYGGYFLALFLFLLFCIDCRIWASAKINYVFIFEFDTRHHLNWRQLSEIPCFLLFLLGLFLWLNFQPSGPHGMFLYWPVLLMALSVFILFVPAPILYHRSREWWAYSNFRLLLAGLYPVEFRDFFLGDMYCSQTYFMGNLELFFCLYGRDWKDPIRCNSSHSRLLGFFTTVPGIWRAFQCLRRYYDTRNAFPHLVNCGKYTFTILFYMSLSLYRLNEVSKYKALFITCATINSVYCSIWDLAMDWSLCNPYANNPFLRDVLGYKHPWVYYLAMILDPLLRFNWVLYALFSNDLQHSALLSFFIAFSEVLRRGIWTLFRVENEHCTNVGRFRASRDVPLPYEIPPSPTSSIAEDIDAPESIIPEDPASPKTRRRSSAARRPSHQPETAQVTSGAALESALSDPSSGSLRQRRYAQSATTPVQRGIARVGAIMTQAHAQDFERKRKPGLEQRESRFDNHQIGGASSDEDDEEDEEEANEESRISRGELMDAQGILRRQRSPPHRPSLNERAVRGSLSERAQRRSWGG